MLQPLSHVRGSDSPVDHKAIAGQAFFEPAGELTVTVRHVLIDTGAQARDVQPGVAALQRVVRPANGFEALRQRKLAVHKLHPKTEALIAELGFHGHHVGPVNQAAVVTGKKRVNETDDFAVDHGPDDGAAVLLRHRHHFTTHGERAPNLHLDAFALTALRDTSQQPDLRHRNLQAISG